MIEKYCFVGKYKFKITNVPFIYLGKSRSKMDVGNLFFRHLNLVFCIKISFKIPLQSSFYYKSVMNCVLSLSVPPKIYFQKKDEEINVSNKLKEKNVFQ